MTNLNLNAHPDVSFVDSESDYNNSFLKVELEADLVKFALTGNILNIKLSEQSYDYNLLLNYLESTYTNQDFKSDFITMMQESFETRYRAKEFLEELQKLLIEFERSL
jgi:hypothetical protein